MYSLQVILINFTMVVAYERASSTAITDLLSICGQGMSFTPFSGKRGKMNFGLRGNIEFPVASFQLQIVGK